ncbi:hypothetical protein F5887DRAFT_1102569, partial [Amanita rubescens]
MSVLQRRTKQTCLALSSALVLFFVILSLTPAFLDLDSHEPFVLMNEKLPPGLNFLGGKQRAMAETTSPEPDPFRARGFTVLDRLYMKNGTFFVVTSDSARFPPREYIISRPVDVGVGNDIAPTDKELQFISPTQAREVLGDHAIPIDGVSFILTDNGQFINHYYHLWGEMILGAWRIYSSLASSVKTVATLPFPSRLILPHISPTEWRDPVNVNGPLLRAAFPSSSVLASDVWNDPLYLGEPVVFQRALLINREAAHGDPLFLVWFKMIAGTWNVTVPPGFWEPLRRTAVENALGYLPE